MIARKKGRNTVIRRSLTIAFLNCLIFFFPHPSQAQIYEINGSPFATEGAPLPTHIKALNEKMIIVDPREHAWGAYSPKGKLIRWGIATAGADSCSDSNLSCRTKIGKFRIYSLGSEACSSNKFDNAPMPYCMFFNGGQALHGSSDVEFENVSHGCVRVHVDDAKWLRYHFVEGPTINNHFRGTMILIRAY